MMRPVNVCRKSSSRQRNGPAFPRHPMLDHVRTTLQSLTVNLEGMQSRNTMIEHLEETAHAVLKQSEGQYWQAAEHLEGTHDPAEVENSPGQGIFGDSTQEWRLPAPPCSRTSQKQLHDEIAEIHQRIALVERQERASPNRR